MNIKNKIILLMLFVLFTAKSYSAEPARVVVDTIKSRALGVDRACTVILPRGFQAGGNRTYPVLYLLHGMWENNTVWAEKGRAADVLDRLTASGEACDMIIVTPDAGGGDPEVYQNGYFDMPGWEYETFFFTELMPYIEKKYNAATDRWHRAVAGLSMGGGGATSYGQRYPEKFCAVYAMSALMSIPENGAARFTNPDGKLARLTRSVIAHNCTDYVKQSPKARIEKLRTLKWFVDCGDDDFLLDRNIEFYQAMRDAGVPCQFRVRDGGHDWEYWHSALYTCLKFVSRAFNPYK